MTSKYKINSVKTKKSRPITSFFFSFLFSGLGEIENGKLSHGIALSLIKFILLLIIPVKNITEKESTSSININLLFIMFIFISLYSPIYSFFLAKRDPKIQIKNYHNNFFYVGFILYSITALFLSLHIISSFYSIKKIENNHISPLYKKGDIVLINKNIKSKNLIGSLIITKKNKITRILAKGKKTIKYKNNFFYINNIQLKHENIQQESIIKNIDYYENLIIEVNNNKKYPIVNFSRKKFKKKSTKFKIKENEFFTALDFRNSEKFIFIINKQDIYGKIETKLVPIFIKNLIKYFLDFKYK